MRNFYEYDIARDVDGNSWVSIEYKNEYLFWQLKKVIVSACSGPCKVIVQEGEEIIAVGFTNAADLNLHLSFPKLDIPKGKTVSVKVYNNSGSGSMHRQDVHVTIFGKK